MQTPEEGGQDKVSAGGFREVPAHDHTQHGLLPLSCTASGFCTRGILLGRFCMHEITDV